MKKQFALWTLLFTITAALRVWGLGIAPLWYDEAGSTWMASLPITQLLIATGADVHPPLQMLIIKPLVMLFGADALAMRLPSALASIVSLYLFIRIGQALKLQDTVIAFGFALMALMPFQLFFAQEARMYSLLQMFVMGMVLAMLERRVILFGVCAVLACYTHNYGVLYTAIIGIMFFIRELSQQIGETRAQDVFVCGVIVVMCYLPWSAVLIGWQMNEYAADWIPAINLPTIIATYLAMFFPVLINGSQAATFVMFSLITLVLMFYSIGVAAIRGQHFTLLTLALAPALLAATVSALWHPMFLWRAFIGSAPFVYLLIATAFADTHRRALISYALILPALVVGVLKYEALNTHAKTGSFDVKAMAQTINEQWLPGDVILHANSGTMMSMWRYTQDKDVYLLKETTRTLGGLTPRTREAMGMREATLDDLQWRRVWLVWSAGELTPPTEDAAVLALVNANRSEEIFVYSDDYTDSGMWLLFNKQLSVGMR